MELLFFSLSLHRFSEWKAAGFCKKSLSFTSKKIWIYDTKIINL